MDLHQELLTLALFVQGILYGVYVTSGGCCLRTILYDEERKSRKNIRWTFFFIALLVLLLSSIDLGISLRITLAAVSGRDTQTYNVINLVNTTIKGLVMLITSGILIYRCWELHPHSWRMIYGLFALWLACLAFLIAYVLGMAILERDTSAVLFLSCNLAITACASIAIVCRTFVSSETTDTRNLGRNTSPRWWTFLESGTLYTLTSSSILVVAAIYDQPATIPLVVDAVNFSMAAITFNAVLASVNLQRDEKDDAASMRDMESEPGMVAQGSRVPSAILTNEYARHIGQVLFM